MATTSDESSEAVEVRFSADNSLLRELGERLVSRPSVALAELVKNSYDADATLVVLRFEHTMGRGGTIAVVDNGEGMTLDTFRRAWMRIATDEKVRNPKSTLYNRPRTGSKGVGRFACQILAKKLRLRSVAIAGPYFEEINIEFDWDKYVGGTSITEVPLFVRRRLLSGKQQTGTTLTLTSTRNVWDEVALSDLRNDIISLVSPFPWEFEAGKIRSTGQKDPGFEVKFDAPDYPEFETQVSRHILDNSWCELKANIDKEGFGNYSVKETKTKTEHTFKSTTRFPSVGDVTLIVYYFVYKAEHFPGVDVDLGEARRLGRRYGGVRVYLDDFRVFRYGERGDDWLDLEFSKARNITNTPDELMDEALDAGRRPMLMLPGNNQVFGAVFLTRLHNPNVELTITRDRLLDNEAFRQLKRFVRLGIDWMTIQYAAATLEERQKVQREKKDPLKLLDSAREQIQLHHRELGSEATTRILAYLDEAKNSFSSEKTRMMTELAMLRVLASTGTLMAIFNHEINALLTDLRSIWAQLKRFSASSSGLSSQNYSKTLQSLEGWIAAVEQEASLFGLLLGRQAREQKKEFVLKQTVEDIFHSFKHYFEEYDIEPQIDVPATLRTPPMFQSELTSVLLNLLTNSIKAVRRAQVRRIALRAIETEARIRISFMDTGPGIPPERRKDVFHAFRSTSEPDPVFGHGTGLGLRIVHDMLQDYGGEISFVDPPSGWGSCANIVLPKE